MVNRTFGIEFEFGLGEEFLCRGGTYTSINWRRLSSTLRNHNFLWDRHEDCGGIELATPVLRESDWPLVASFCEFARTTLQGTTAGDWGTHVHVSVEDLDGPARLLLTGLWTELEPTLFRLVAPKRRENHWCWPLRLSGYSWESLRQAALFGRWQELPSKRAIGFSGFDTLECRLHHCSLDVAELEPWTHMLQALVECASVESPATLDKLLHLYEDPMDVLTHIVDTYLGCSIGAPVVANLKERWCRYAC